MKPIIVLAPCLLAATFALYSPSAKADNVSGYVCGVTHRPLNSVGESQGDAGSLTVALHSLPGCNGKSLRLLTFCSTNASLLVCDKDWLYSEAQLMAMYQNVTQALVNENPITMYFQPRPGTAMPIAQFISIDARY